MKPAPGHSVPWTTDAGQLAIRVMLGVVFLYHGGQKLFGWFGGSGLAATGEFMAGMGIPLPELSAFLAGAAEFAGGLAVLLGIGVRLAVVPMVFTMLVASFVVHGQAFGLRNGGMEYALTLAVVLTGLGLTGPGRWTLPALIRCRRPGVPPTQRPEQPAPAPTADA